MEHLVEPPPEDPKNDMERVATELTPDQRWQRFSSERPDLTIASLAMAQQFREARTEPGEAFLRGLDILYAVLTEPERKRLFLEMTEAMWLVPSSDASYAAGGPPPASAPRDGQSIAELYLG